MRVKIVGGDASKRKDHVNGVGQKGFVADQVGKETDVMETWELQEKATYVPEQVIMATKYFSAF